MLASAISRVVFVGVIGSLVNKVTKQPLFDPSVWLLSVVAGISSSYVLAINPVIVINKTVYAGAEEAAWKFVSTCDPMDPNYEGWNPEKVYAKNDFCKYDWYGQEHEMKVWQSLIDNNVGNEPGK